MSEIRRHARIIVPMALGLFFFGGVSHWAEAHEPNMVRQNSEQDITRIDDPELSRAFYGEMQGFPHTFEVRVAEPFMLFVRVLVPDIDGAPDNVEVIIIKERPEGGRVEEVARLKREDEWPVEYEFWGGDSYRMGPAFEEEVSPGTYRIQVYTPDNVEKYTLVVGKREEMKIGYFELLGRMAEVKEFFGKPKIAILASPLVFGPLLLLVALFWALWRYIQKRSVHTG